MRRQVCPQGRLPSRRPIRQSASRCLCERKASPVIRALADRSGGPGTGCRVGRSHRGGEHGRIRFRGDPRFMKRRDRGRMEDAAASKGLANLEGRHRLRRGFRQDVSRHLERAKKDILLELGRFPPIMETAARVAKREFSNPVSAHPQRPRQTGRPADHEWRGGARAFAAGSGHPHSIQPMKGDLGKPCAITR